MSTKPVWENLSLYALPVVYGHQHSGQPTACLDGLVKYAADIADRREAYVYDTPAKIMRWIYTQPVVLDLGEEPHIAGCNPLQRSRIWPTAGLNCWEAVAHLLGVAFPGFLYQTAAMLLPIPRLFTLRTRREIPQRAQLHLINTCRRFSALG